MSDRMKKVNTLIKKHLAEIIAHDVDFANTTFVTISKVDTSRDIRYAHVFVSVYPKDKFDYALKTLKNEIRSIQKKLNKKLHMKNLPLIAFHADHAEEELFEVDTLLRKE